MNKPKIAILLRGHIRRGFTTDDLKEAITAISNEFDTDIYIHTWSISEAKYSYRPLLDNKLPVNEDTFLNYSKAMSNKIKWLAIDNEEDIKLIGDTQSQLGKTRLPKIGWKRMWYGIYQASLAITESGETYAAVLNMRLDNFYFYNQLTHPGNGFMNKRLAIDKPLQMIKEFLDGFTLKKFVLHQEEKIWGLDNFYVTSPEDMHFLASKFHIHLDQQMGDFIEPEYSVYKEMQHIEKGL